MNHPATNNTSAQRLFRKNALMHMETTVDHAISLKIIQPYEWLWIVAILIALIGLMIWGIFGTITLTVPAVGIVIPEMSHIIPIHATADGTISAVMVHQGQQVKKGDILSTVFNPALTDSLHLYETLHSENIVNLSRFYIGYKKRKNQLIEQYNSRSDYLKNEIQFYKISVKSLHDLLEAKKKLLHKKYISSIDYEKSRLEYYNANEKLNNLKNNLNQTSLDFNHGIDLLKEKKDLLTKKYMEIFYNLRQKKIDIKNGLFIRSPADGTVTGTYITPGENIIKQKKIFSVAAHKNNTSLEVLAFIKSEDGKSITAGAKALVLPQNQSPYKEGYIEATVSSVSKYPITRQTAILYLGNEALVDDFFKSGAPFLATILFPHLQEPNTVLKFTGQHHPINIDAGTIMTVKLVTNKYSPLDIVLKNIKK